MLTLFENITEDLTAHEKTVLVPMFVSTLSNSHDENRMRGKNVCAWFKASGEHVSEARLRKLVNFCRTTNAFRDKVLIGASDGYYLTNDVHAISDQIESLEGRIDSMKNVVDSLKAQRHSLKRTA